MLRNNRFFVNTIGRLALFAGLCLAVVIGTALMSQSSAQLTRMIGIHAIKLGDDDGGRSAGVNPQQVKQWVDKANEIYAPTGIQFHFDPDPGGPDWSTLVNTALNNLSSFDQRGWELANQVAARYPDKLVVFFRHGQGATPTGNGFAFPPQSGLITNFVAMPGFNDTGVIVGKDRNGQWIWRQNIGLLAHEIGHYLGLYHTFPGWNDSDTDSSEKASDYISGHGGNSQALDGDALADTPPEAGTAFYINNGWDPCVGHNSYVVEGSTLRGTARNPREIPFRIAFTPDRHNTMSYFPCEPHTFTPMQIALMRRTLASRSSPGDLTGVWSADDGGLYYVRQVSNVVWWVGLSTESPRGINDFHKGIRFTNVFRGQLSGNVIDGEWADVPRGEILQTGRLTVTAPSSVEIRKTAFTGGFGASKWTRMGAAPEPCDFPCRFRYVRRNDGGTMEDYLDEIDDYNHVATGVIQSPVLAVNFPPAVPRTYFNFMCPTIFRFNRAPWYFNLFSDPPDGDIHFDMRVAVEGRNYHPELIMFGRSAGDRFCNNTSQFDIPPLLPGWADTGANSVLLNGRPINSRITIGDSDACRRMAFNNDEGSCPAEAILDKPIGNGTLVRITGARVKDEHGTLELHPVYSVDILQNFHLPRPGANLTGAWSATDLGPYYVRQVGNTVWWFGMSRDQGRSFANIFRGNITRNPLQGITISGEWADVPLGAIKNSGTLIVHADGNPDSPELTRTSATGNFGALTWTKLYDVPRGDLNAAGSPSRN